MINYVVKQGENYFVRPALGFKPEGVIGVVPDNIPQKDWPYLKVSSVMNAQGVESYSYSVDHDKKNLIEKSREKKHLVSEAYKKAYDEISAKSLQVFGTVNGDVATFEERTWYDMIEDAADYATFGMKTKAEMLNEDGTELFSKGSALDTADKITKYAQGKIREFKELKKFRKRRMQQFYAEREAITKQ